MLLKRSKVRWIITIKRMPDDGCLKNKTKTHSHRAAELAEKFAKYKDCIVQMQSLIAFYE